ncbi:MULTISPECIES: Gfo/Idh/MocA family protein [unclassified Micromonospora]|uniref:Gfo/Idh/MocA family protein n=1 Tax=unclassified Micromonospora TaxID=2617518 RepID=UPI00098D0ABC|nr:MULTISPECIES: Gfo/Idh/MocA family oxidoreductase [unclassified Micromonospora]MDI5936651.1 Gfo/Idh/MocA family oxidoreductase [Micromonospora sp. DH15]OON32470.1 hypothetical protein BSA16_05500 [Micromonospora sp. Rc5]
MGEPLRLAVVGYGQTAGQHTRIMNREGHHLVWSVGRMPEPTAAFARQYGFDRHTTDLAEALDDPTLDAVIVCTPNELHAPQAAACLAAGKHVLVEIPLAMSYAEGRDLADTARRRGLTLMVGHTHRFHGAMRTVREEVVSGRLAPHSITARYLMIRRSNQGSNGYLRSWTDNLLWHHGQHATDTALWMLGIDEPGGIVEVTPMFSRPDRDRQAPLDIALVLRTRLDQLVTISLSYNSFINVYDYVVAGREDTFAIEAGMLRDRAGVRFDNAEERAVPDYGSRVDQDREFVEAVRAGRPPAISADSVLPALEVLQRAQDAYDARPDPEAFHPIENLAT